MAFEFRTVHDVAQRAFTILPEDARTLYDLQPGAVCYSPSQDNLYLTDNSSIHVVCNGVDGRMLASAPGSTPELTRALSHLYFSLPLLEVLRRRGLFAVHAAGIAQNGRSALIAGASGSGKTTTALCLLRAGFDFLGDDVVFLRRASAGLQALAFTDEADVTDKSLRWFPELRVPGLETGPHSRGLKVGLRAEQAFGADIAWTSTPAAVVFPSICESRKSTLATLPPDQALFELMGNLILTEPRCSQAHFDLLADLVREVPCFRLQAGADLGQIAELVGGILAGQPELTRSTPSSG